VQVVVIGAGVIGLSVATELARRGTRVTVVEQEAPGAGTSTRLRDRGYVAELITATRARQLAPDLIIELPTTDSPVAEKRH